MLTIPSRKLSPPTADHLKQQQELIDNQSTFTAKVKQAKKLWNSKESSKAKQEAFKEIKKLLKEMSVGLGYCCYCEHGEVNDIEHIFTKTLFPNKAFEWENYLYACKKCNMSEKNDEFSVFDINNRELDAKQYCKQHQQLPPTEDTLLIHPRVENPFSYLALDLIDGVFTGHPDLNNSKDIRRAEYTMDILRLNEREELVEARKNAAILFYHLLNDYIIIQQATSLEGINSVLAKYVPKASIEFESLAIAQKYVAAMFKEHIQKSNHQTVWEEMKRQKNKLEKLHHLFQQAPQALTW